MSAFWQTLLSPQQFIPHGHCFLWNPSLIWLHLLSDAMIAIAYFSIPAILIYFVRRRKDVPFSGVFWLFGAFIVSCGLTHLISIWTLWHPAYWLSGAAKALTAVISLYTALTLIPLMPRALALPSPSQLALVNQKLSEEITEREQSEKTTRQLNQVLEDRVAQRTTELQRRNQELDQFAYVVSHDLKAPLRAIATLSEWIEEDLTEQLPAENQEQLRLLRSRVYRMDALINGLLDYSRVGRSRQNTARVDVAQLLTDVLQLIDVPETFTVEISPDLPVLVANRTPLTQVFTNLISNAIKHHDRPDGIVRISAKTLDDCYEFAIADDGPGISPKYHQRIFEIFKTLEARDTKESTGVGLAIVKKTVESEGGSLRLESDVGCGACFYFTWPKPVPAHAKMKS
ncbi:MAG: histidine kinase [Leptolyngbya sp. SIO4C1]|nr:histidine kinase [Leptolyngbya sp. SIO4C1]